MDMRLNSTSEDVSLKQEENDQRHNEISNSLSSLRGSQWNNPRVVRVSRAFGGKDRHSKVFTVRGLRDRRIRLSVTTAIQVYDLQERLGLNQPSKVIDWLLEAAKNDVDLLLPLQFPPGFHQMINPNITGLGVGQSTNFPWIFESNFNLGSRESLDNHHHHHHFSNSIQSNKLYNSPTSSYHYNIGHLQQSTLDQSGNVTVAFPNNSNANDLNQPALESVSSLFPRQPSFLGGGQLQLFGDHENSLDQTDDHIE